MSHATKRTIEMQEEPVRVLGRGLRAQRGVHLTLRTLREAAGKTQVDVTGLSQMDQADISRLEGRESFDDCQVSTLQRYLSAIGGRLELVAAFGDKRIVVAGVQAGPSGLSAAKSGLSAAKAVAAGGSRAAAERCAQHGRRLGGASPPERRPSQTKRTATAKGQPIVGRKRGAKSRADVQESDPRRRRVGRAGKWPRSSDGQGSGGVNLAAVRGRTAFLPGESSPCA